MELSEAIATRRSIRSYTSEPVSRETIEALLRTAVHAPSAMNSQPWSFGIITDGELLRDLSSRAKAGLLERMSRMPWLEPLREHLQNPEFNIFYGAPALVVIYARSAAPHSEGDCCLAAMTLMLAAWDEGLGSCWIGLSQSLLDSPEVKVQLDVPADYRAVAPIILGHPAGPGRAQERGAPQVAFWR